MDFVKMALVSMAVLPVGLGSIHVAETLRWYEPRRGLWRIAIAADSAFFAACALLMLHRGDAFTAGGYFLTVFQMLFAAYFLVALAYLLHCVTWVMDRLGRNVHLDELFSRLIALAIFAAVDVVVYLAMLAFE